MNLPAPQLLFPRVVVFSRGASGARLLEGLLALGFEVPAVVLSGGIEADAPLMQAATAVGIEALSLEQLVAQVESGQLVADWGLSFDYPRLFRGRWFEAWRGGIVNLHPAPLPDYRGVGGVNLAILHGLSHWGASAHYVDQGIDSGPLIAQCRFAIAANATAFSLKRDTLAHMLQLALSVARDISHHGLLPTTANIGGHYYRRAEVEAMKQLMPGDDVSRKVRAFWYPPYDGAWLEIEHVRYSLCTPELMALWLKQQ